MAANCSSEEPCLGLTSLSSADGAEKEFLCCFGERKRPVKFKVDPMKGDFNSALEVLRTTFEDVIAPTCQVFLQLKHEDWSGEFVDIGEMDTIPDRSVIRAVVERQVCGWLV